MYFNKSQVGENAFGIVTVMDVEVYECDKVVDALITDSQTPAAFLSDLKKQKVIARIEHMQVATLSTDGPSITINGGRYNNPLLKHGKTARCEMTDALGQADALVALGGAEYNESDGSLSITDKFGGPKTLVGTSFVVDQKSGKHVPVTIIIYKFLPDSTPTFAFDSGNAATFDLNGDLLAVELGGREDVQAGEECGDGNGVFFSMLPTECSLPDADDAVTKPAEKTDDIIIAPAQVTRIFGAQQADYADVVAVEGKTPVLRGYKANGELVSATLGSIANNKLTLVGDKAAWANVAFVRFEGVDIGE